MDGLYLCVKVAETLLFGFPYSMYRLTEESWKDMMVLPFQSL